MHKINFVKIVIIFTVIVIGSCTSNNYNPYPRGYFRVFLPKHAYQSFAEQGFPYHFEYPTYSKIAKDTLFFNEKPENPYWMNIEFDSTLGAKIYLTYKQLSSKEDLAKCINDTYKMTDAHDKRAEYIKDPIFHTANNVHGVFFEVGGNAASAIQFFATDSNKHFLRGALYFSVTPNADSLRPANEFCRADVEHFIKTLKWTK